MKKILFILSLLLFACQTSQKEEVDLKALKEEVLAIHDEVMPKMGDLRRTRKTLMLQADSIKDTDSLRAAKFLIASDSLDVANESMMNWMRNFEPEFTGSEEEIFKYLTDQKASIEEVRAKMVESWENGKKVLGTD